MYYNQDILYAEFLDFKYKLIPLIFSISGLFSSLMVYFFFYNSTAIFYTTSFFNWIYWFLVKKWYFDLIYNNLFVFRLLSAFYSLTFKLVDRGFIEFFGPLTVVRSISKLSAVFSLIQTGFIYNYIFVMLLGTVLFLKILLYTASIDSAVNFKLIVCMIGTIFFLIFNKKDVKL